MIEKKKRPRSIAPGARLRSSVAPTTPFATPELCTGSLMAGATRSVGTITVQLLGSADFTLKDRLDEFLAKVHLESLRLGITLVVVDMRGLAFMSSACIQSLTAWICGVASLEEVDQYRIQLENNPTIHWQSKSVPALCALAPHLVEALEGR